MTSDVVIGMEIMRDNAIETWRNIIGPTSTQAAQQQAPNSIRAMFGTDNTRNAVHGSDSGPSVKRESEFFFSG